MALNIKILGTGCPKCKTLERLTTEVVSENGFDAEIQKVEDIVQIMGYRILATPGLVINEKVHASGRVPSKEEIKKLIENHANG
ncbi:MAG: thioredoxin family protein [Bacteroidales bacterium]